MRADHQLQADGSLVRAGRFLEIPSDWLAVRRRIRRAPLLIIVFTSLAAVPQELAADPLTTLTVTSGHVIFRHASDDPTAYGELGGLGFSLRFDLYSTLGGPTLPNDRPVLDPSFVFPGVVVGELEVAGRTISLDDPHRLVLAIDSIGPSIFVPLLEFGNGFSLQFPFLLTGELSGPSAVYALRGIGTAVSVYGFTPQTTVVDFESAGPMPEPGTLALLATGILAVVRRKPRRRSCELERSLW
jgi:hypothetical protein